MKSRLSVLLVLVGATACRDSHSEKSPPGAKRDPAPRPAGGEARDAGDPRVAHGAELHLKYCALCHGRDARGYAADNAPSLVASTFLASAADPFLTRSIQFGRPGTAMAAYGKDAGGPLAEGDITDLVAFYRSQGPGLKALVPSLGGVAARGAPLYAQACQRCHGDATTRGTAPHLANPAFLTFADDSFLRYAIASGRPGTPMEAFGGKLAPAQIDDLVAYLRSLARPLEVPAPAPLPGPLPNGGPIVINAKGKPPTFTPRDDRFVSAAQVAKALADKRRLVIVDARAPSDWAREHIPGALSIPYYELKALDQIPNDGTWVVAYCACPHHASGIIVDELRTRGYKHTAVLDEGILVWQQQKLPVVNGAGVTPPPPPTAPPVTPPVQGAVR